MKVPEFMAVFISVLASIYIATFVGFAPIQLSNTLFWMGAIVASFVGSLIAVMIPARFWDVLGGTISGIALTVFLLTLAGVAAVLNPIGLLASTVIGIVIVELMMYGKLIAYG